MSFFPPSQLREGNSEAKVDSHGCQHQKPTPLTSPESSRTTAKPHERDVLHQQKSVMLIFTLFCCLSRSSPQLIIVRKLGLLGSFLLRFSFTCRSSFCCLGCRVSSLLVKDRCWGDYCVYAELIRHFFRCFVCKLDTDVVVTTDVAPPATTPLAKLLLRFRPRLHQQP